MKHTKWIIPAAIVLLAIAPARAQVSVDVAKITCDQFLAFKVADPRDIAIRLSGDYHGKSGSMVLEPQTLRQNAEKLKTACFNPVNAGVPVIQIIERSLVDKK
jgi:hypothetical protein